MGIKVLNLASQNFKFKKDSTKWLQYFVLPYFYQWKCKNCIYLKLIKSLAIPEIQKFIDFICIFIFYGVKYKYNNCGHLRKCIITRRQTQAEYAF